MYPAVIQSPETSPAVPNDAASPLHRPGKASFRWLPHIALAVVICGGAFIRLSNIGSAGFGSDELIQYFVAQSIVDGEGARLPSGEPYTRGEDVSRMIAASLQLLGDSPFAMRLPSAIMGILVLVLFAWILWRLIGPWGAVTGTLLLAVFPEAVFQSRHVRFYTYQQLFGLAALYCGWRSVAGAGAKEAPATAQRTRQALWILATAVAFALAARVQVVSLSTAIGWGCCLLVAAAFDLRARGRSAFRNSVPAQVAAGGISAAILGIIAAPDMFVTLVHESQLVPHWARLEPSGRLDYYYSLVAQYPLVISLLPIIVLTAVVTRPLFGLFLTTWFAVPLAIHSLLLPWSGMRFVLLAMPALFALAGYAGALGGAALFTWMSNSLGRYFGSRTSRTLAYAATCAAFAVALLTLPAFNTARKAPAQQSGNAEGWSTTAQLVDSVMRMAPVPFGHSVNLDPLYHTGRLDFSIARSKLEQYVPRPDGKGGQFAWMPDGYADWYSGRPVLTTPSSIARAFHSHTAVLIGLDTRRTSVDIEPALLQVLENEAIELCKGRCGTLRLYYWHLPSAGAPDSYSRGWQDR